MPRSKVMSEYKAGRLHSGKGGPIVKSRKQAVAIMLSEARDEGRDASPKRSRPKRRKYS